MHVQQNMKTYQMEQLFHPGSTVREIGVLGRPFSPAGQGIDQMSEGDSHASLLGT